MKITLKKKYDASDKDPLIVQYMEGPEGNQKKTTIPVKIGETLDLPDDVAYDVLSKYRGLFSMEGAGGTSEKTTQYAHKSGKGPASEKTAPAE